LALAGDFTVDVAEASRSWKFFTKSLPEPKARQATSALGKAIGAIDDVIKRAIPAAGVETVGFFRVVALQVFADIALGIAQGLGDIDLIIDLAIIIDGVLRRFRGCDRRGPLSD
jgi:hypothetical protein